MNEGGWKTSWWKGVEGKGILQRGMEQAPEDGKESSHSAHANGMNEWMNYKLFTFAIFIRHVQWHFPDNLQIKGTQIIQFQAQSKFYNQHVYTPVYWHFVAQFLHLLTQR